MRTNATTTTTAAARALINSVTLVCVCEKL